MSKLVSKLVMFLVGGHLLFGLILMVIEWSGGIDDQGPSFAAALLFYYLNLPSVGLLSYLGITPYTPLPIILVGILQWAGLALLISAVYYPFRSRGRVNTLQAGRTPEQADGGGDGVAGSEGVRWP